MSDVLEDHSDAVSIGDSRFAHDIHGLVGAKTHDREEREAKMVWPHSTIGWPFKKKKQFFKEALWNITGGEDIS